MLYSLLELLPAPTASYDFPLYGILTMKQLFHDTKAYPPKETLMSVSYSFLFSAGHAYSLPEVRENVTLDLYVT